jgi:NitT/TauT family transport system permease protein
MSASDLGQPAGRSAGRRAGHRGRGTARLGFRIAAPLVALALVLALWQSGVIYSLFGLQEFTVPKPATIFSTLAGNWSSVWGNQQTTLVEAVTGYLLGSAAGFGAAVLVTATGVGRRLLPGLAGALNAVPIVATAPVAVLYLGYGGSSKVAIVAILTAAVMLLNACKGLNAVDPDQLHLMHSYASTRWQIIVKLRIPSALPYVFTALKYNVTLALVGAIIAEFFGGYGGVGIEMIQALSGFSMTLVWAAMLLVGVTGIVWYEAVTALEWGLNRWYPSAR